MDRVYSTILQKHLKQDKQMIFLAGPRQVGKTTISKSIENLGHTYTYLNWDAKEDQQAILSGHQHILDLINLAKIRSNIPVVIFDEIHKYKNWKNFLKGFYDKYSDQVRIIVTGSAKLNIYRKKSDSLMGRYFLYRVHPFSIAETLYTQALPDTEIRSISEEIDFNQNSLDDLLNFGGFPDPFIKKDLLFKNRWQQLKTNQLFKEDILEITNIHDITLLEQLAFQLKYIAGNLVNKNSLSTKLQVAESTIKTWLDILEQTYYCFLIPPWSKNISRSILKAPKVYLWDWSEVNDLGQRIENLVACHLLKAVNFWSDYGFGGYKLYFIRNKDKQEVDFIITKNNEPWILVEVKNSDEKLSKSLIKFQRETKAPFAFQVVNNLPFSNIDCFNFKDRAVVVPLSSFLLHLV